MRIQELVEKIVGGLPSQLIDEAGSISFKSSLTGQRIYLKESGRPVSEGEIRKSNIITELENYSEVYLISYSGDVVIIAKDVFPNFLRGVDRELEYLHQRNEKDDRVKRLCQRCAKKCSTSELEVRKSGVIIEVRELCDNCFQLELIGG